MPPTPLHSKGYSGALFASILSATIDATGHSGNPQIGSACFIVVLPLLSFHLFVCLLLVGFLALKCFSKGWEQEGGAVGGRAHDAFRHL